MSDTHLVEPLLSMDCEQEILARRCTLGLVNGQMLSIYLDSGETDEISRAIADGTYRFPFEFYLLPELIESNHRVLDLGGHIGTFSLFSAALGYQVVSVEASPRNATLLRHSAHKNGFAGLRVVSAAVSDRVGTLDFHHDGPVGVVSNPSIRGPTVSVSTVTVDKLLDKVGWDRVDFIKMDIEGSEVAAIRGMSRLLSQKDAPVILCESNGHTLNFFGETPAHLMALLQEHGYSCYLVDGNKLIPSRPDELQAEVCVNYLATKRPLSDSISRPIAPPISASDRVVKVLSMSIGSNVHGRAHLARALSQADPSILSDRRIVNALRVLITDGDSGVRAEMAWWQAHESRRTWACLFCLGDEENSQVSSRVLAHQCFRAILRLDLKIARVGRRLDRLVHSLPGLFRRFLSAVKARSKRG